MSRLCCDCGARGGEASFPGTRKPRGRADRCDDCLADPLAQAQARVAARRAEILSLREAKQSQGRQYRAPKPLWTAPLFAGLRP